MMRPLKKWYQRQQFEPGGMGWLVNPFYLARRGLRQKMGELLPNLQGEVLDVGCGTKPYRALVPATRYVGLDYDTPMRRADGHADVYYDGGKFPLPDAAFDGVLCTQVLEHVFNPQEFLGEIHRVLRPGGVMVLAVPFVWDEHEQPYDFGRYSSFGLRSLFERSGFEVLRFEKTPTDARAVAQIAAGWIYKATSVGNRWARLGAQLAFIAPLSLVGELAAAVLPRNEDFYLDNIVLVRRPLPAAA